MEGLNPAAVALLDQQKMCVSKNRPPPEDMQVDPLSSEDYAHRKNEDGTFDSICLYCFRTIASAKDESDLGVREKRHSCDAKIVCRKIAKRDHQKH